MSKAILVAGLAFGDEGKGAAVDYLVRQYSAKCVVRYNGGAQAAHNVVLPDGTHHKFSQFGSGTFIPDVRTHLSRFMMVNPGAMLVEADFLDHAGVKDAMDRTSVDRRCLITTPLHMAMNRIREAHRGDSSHGSCGAGIGETRRFQIVYPGEEIIAEDCFNEQVLRAKLENMQARFREEIVLLGIAPSSDNHLMLSQSVEPIVERYKEWVDSVDFVTGMDLRRCPNVVFEGAQGVLLDERKEFAPHNTWSKTTFENADEVLIEAKFGGSVVRVGCLRAYLTRHGKGPFRTEDARLDGLDEQHNNDKGFQGKFRRGHFDAGLIKQALDICPVDEIIMSHLDQLPRIYPGIDIDRYVRNIEQLLETPIATLGFGPAHTDRRRNEKLFTARRRDFDTRPRRTGSTQKSAAI